MGMTNQEAIKTTEKFITDLEASDIPIYADEKELMDKTIDALNEIGCTSFMLSEKDIKQMFKDELLEK